jgi:hypothetical protein
VVEDPPWGGWLGALARELKRGTVVTVWAGEPIAPAALRLDEDDASVTRRLRAAVDALGVVAAGAVSAAAPCGRGSPI